MKITKHIAILAAASLAGRFILFAAADNPVIIAGEINGVDFNTSTELYNEFAGTDPITGEEANFDAQNGTAFKDLDMSYGRFFEAEMTDVNLSGKNISNSMWMNVSLNNSNLSGANLSYTDNWIDDLFPVISNITAVESNFRGTNFSGMKIHEFTATGSDFTNADFRGCEFYYLDMLASFGNTWDGVKLEGAWFAKSYLSQEFLEATAEWQNGYIKLGFYEMDASNLDFTGIDMTGSWFEAGRLNSQSGPQMSANLTDAIINFVSFGYSNLSREQLESTASWKNKNLMGLDIAGEYDKFYDFTAQKMHFANMASYSGGADLTNADLRGGTDFVYGGGTPVNGSIVKNTVISDGTVISTGADGKIRYGVELDSSDDLLLVYKFDTSANINNPSQEHISAKISVDSTAGGGSTIHIEEGGRLDVNSGATFTVTDAKFEFFASNTDKSLITVYGEMNLSELNEVLIIVSDDFQLTGYYEFIDGLDGNIVGEMDPSKVKVQYADGRDFETPWIVQQDEFGWGINIFIPEPSTYAAIFGTLALAMAAYRKKRQEKVSSAA